MKTSKFVFCILFFAACLNLRAQKTIINLSEKNWEFSQEGFSLWYPATIPGCIHTDLLNNALIPDPYLGINEKNVQWIENNNWTYRTDFILTDSFLFKKNIFLLFEGLDTYSEVFLNNTSILQANNMFRPWKVDCKKYLISGKNELLIHFTSVVSEAKHAYSDLPAPLPYDERVMARKAQYQFGWDWGPRLVTMGIWKPVQLIAWDQARINDFWYQQKSLDDKNAKLLFFCEIESDSNHKADFELMIRDIVVKKVNVSIFKGLNTIQIPYTIQKPELWWPSGIGKQNLYNIKIRLSSDKQLIDSFALKIGLRTIELITQNDTTGSSFYFQINGLPIFAKGANYIPQESFPSHFDSSKYQHLLSDAKASRMNMLRVWGGGIYENDYFYQLCDEKGLLVWQDFMFACNMYPGDSLYINNVSQEITANVKRLRNHPSLTLWCGNNEVDEGWNNWGMQKQFSLSAQDSARIWNDYLNLFHRLIPDILKKTDPSTPYHSSSPLYGWGRKESMTAGDSHYWGIWWGNQPFEVFNTKVPRFMSEYGFQGFPSNNTLNSFTGVDDRYLFSEVIKAHEKHPRGFELINAAMQRDYWIPDTFTKYSLLSQFVQARAIKIAIEAHRRARPRCMGSLYWQFNDCWPAISWSGIDYYGNWKAAQYTIKETFSNIILSTVIENSILKVYGISDSNLAIPATLKIKIFSNTGTPLWSIIKDTLITPASSNVLFEMPLSHFIPHFDSTNCFLYAEIKNKFTYLATTSFLFCKPKNYQQPDFKTEIIILKSDSLKCLITFKPDVPVFGFFIESDDPSLQYSDNFFNIFPWNPKTIIITSDFLLSNPEKKIRINNLNALR